MIYLCSWDFIRGNDWGFDRPRNREWICEGSCSWSHFGCCFFHWSLWIFTCFVEIRWIWDWLSSILGEQFYFSNLHMFIEFNWALRGCWKNNPFVETSFSSKDINNVEEINHKVVSKIQTFHQYIGKNDNFYENQV